MNRQPPPRPPVPPPPGPNDPEYLDLCASLDGHIRGRLVTPEQRAAANKRLDTASVHRHQLSPQAFRDEWGEWPSDTYPYPTAGDHT